MTTTFKVLSIGWNADPDAPEPCVSVSETTLTLAFGVNYYVYPEFKNGDQGQIIFTDCWRYRLGSTNDEGWYLGQCRFSKKAPAWGEFYEVGGDLLVDHSSANWKILAESRENNSKHFLFYFRDETFECDAADFALTFSEHRGQLVHQAK